MDELERLLAKRYWQPYSLRTSIAPRDRVVEKNGFRKAMVASNTPGPRETSLLSAIRAVAPAWHEDTKVILNKDVTCKRHRDGANLGSSYILFLGDFEGGALVFDDGTRFEAKREWLEFDGQVPHWNEPHTGTKFSVVLYRTSVPPCETKSRLIRARAGASAGRSP